MSLMGKYEYIIDKTHPKANKHGQVYSHIIVAENKLGRRLLDEEVVHHRDCNKLNNNPLNIIVFATKADHTRFHHNGCNEEFLILNQNGSYSCLSKIHRCVDCGKPITRQAIRCVDCINMYQRRVVRPDKDTLFNMMTNFHGNFTKISKMYGVSDNTIRKWCKSYKIPYRTSDYMS